MKSRLNYLTTLLLALAILLVASSLLTACGGGAPAATPTPSVTPKPTEPPGDPAAGKIAYEKTCIACHGADLKGMPNLGKDLTTSEFVKGKTNLEMLDFLKVGRPASDPLNTQGVDMPPKGGNPALTDADLLNIVVYVRSQQAK
jgi:disulfide bond formation protein DsbB